MSGDGLHTIGAPGIYILNARSYHADPCPAPSLSSSIAKVLLDQSPLHAWMRHPRGNPAHQPDERDEFDLGSTCHALVLEGEDDIVVVEADDWRTKAAKEKRDEARGAGKVALLQRHHQTVHAMAARLRSQIAKSEDARLLGLLAGDAEKTIVWRERNGVWCRARPDWLRSDQRLIADYKTTTNAEPGAWIRGQLFGLGYDLQAAFYLRGLRAVTGHDAAAWRWVVQETKPPYAASVIAPTPAVLVLAEKKVQRAIDLWGDCLKADQWPGYEAHTAWANLPSYQETRWLERETRDADLPTMAAG